VEFFECKIEGDVTNCLFENCIIRNSKLSECTIYSNNLIKFSKLIDCDYSGGANEVVSSYLDNNNDKMINAELRECLVNRGIVSLESKVDKSTKFVRK
jgi:hypothetical protein